MKWEFVAGVACPRRYVGLLYGYPLALVLFMAQRPDSAVCSGFQIQVQRLLQDISAAEDTGQRRSAGCRGTRSTSAPRSAVRERHVYGAAMMLAVFLARMLRPHPRVWPLESMIHSPTLMCAKSGDLLEQPLHQGAMVAMRERRKPGLLCIARWAEET